MSDPAPVVPSPAVFVAAFIAAYYAAAGRYVVADFDGENDEYESDPPYVAVFDTDPRTADPHATDDRIAFITRSSGSGVDIFVVDNDDGRETWHARVRSDFDFAAVRDACENGVAFD